MKIDLLNKKGGKMLVVRFPSGQAVTYNSAENTSIDSNGMINLVDKKGYWIAQIPKETQCIIEANLPCKLENPMTDLTEKKAIEIVSKNLRHYNNGSSETLAAIKRELRFFNAKKLEWE